MLSLQYKSGYVQLQDQENLFCFSEPQFPHWCNWIDDIRLMLSTQCSDGMRSAYVGVQGIWEPLRAVSLSGRHVRLSPICRA